MRYLHDVWVNFIEDEENLNLIHHFHEWNKSDDIQLMDQIPLLKVNQNLFNFIAFGLNKLPQDLLKRIKEKAYLRKNHERIQIEYAFVCTDGRGVIAVELDINGKVLKKSRLIMRQARLALEISDEEKLDFTLDNEVDVSNYSTFAGMTRQEKDLLFKSSSFINRLLPEKIGLLKYLIAEWNLDLHRNLAASTFDEIKNRLLEEIKGSEIGRLIEFNKVIGKVSTIN
jgi:hypothetical protein